MNYHRLPSGSKLFDVGRPITHEGGPKAVLILHGWTGWTGRLAYLGERLAEAGFTVRIPRLPGHGSNLPDFLLSTWKDWVRRAIDEFLDLKDRSETVYLAGASMGAILATIVAAQFQVKRVALLAPAFLANNPVLWLAPVMQYIVPRIPSDWSPDNDPDPNSRAIGLEYKSHGHVPAAAQLVHLQRAGRRALPRLESETLIIASRSDEAVPVRVAEYIARRSSAAKVETLILEKSGHQIVQGVERDVACDAVVRWFSA